MSKLSKKDRARLKSSDFVFPETRSYPINDKGHAQWAVRIGAIQFTRGNLSVAEYNKIAQAVNTRYSFNVQYKNPVSYAQNLAA